MPVIATRVLAAKICEDEATNGRRNRWTRAAATSYVRLRVRLRVRTRVGVRMVGETVSNHITPSAAAVQLFIYETKSNFVTTKTAVNPLNRSGLAFVRRHLAFVRWHLCARFQRYILYTGTNIMMIISGRAHGHRRHSGHTSIYRVRVKKLHDSMHWRMTYTTPRKQQKTIEIHIGLK